MIEPKMFSVKNQQTNMTILIKNM